MNDSIKHPKVTIDPELAKIDGGAFMAEKMERAQKRLANLDVEKLLKLVKEANEKNI